MGKAGEAEFIVESPVAENKAGQHPGQVRGHTLKHLLRFFAIKAVF